MPTREHPLYADWKEALDKLVSAKDVLDSLPKGAPMREDASKGFYDALRAYCDVARKISLTPR